MHESEKWTWSHSVISDSSRPHGLQPSRLLHPWDFPSKGTGVGCHCFLWWPRQSVKKQRHHFADKDVSSQSYGFPIVMYVWMWELDHKEGWVLENWYFWTMVLEKTLENFLNCKIKVINHKENQSWIFIGKTDAEPEAPTLWLPDVTNKLVGKGPDSGKDWRQKEKGQHGLRWLDYITNSTNMNSGKLQEIVKDKGACHATVQRVTKSGHKWTDEQQEHLKSCIHLEGRFDSNLHFINHFLMYKMT